MINTIQYVKYFTYTYMYVHTYVQVHRWADGNGADLRLTDM